MRAKKRKRCTQVVEGVVTNLKSRGLDSPTVISVEYQVDGKSYIVKESIKLRNETIKIGFLPIGQRGVPRMGDTTVGSAASINYNPSNPTEAYISKNIGIMNA